MEAGPPPPVANCTETQESSSHGHQAGDMVRGRHGGSKSVVGVAARVQVHVGTSVNDPANCRMPAREQRPHSAESKRARHLDAKPLFVWGIHMSKDGLLTLNIP